MNHTLEFAGVGKSFDAATVLHDVSFAVRPGEFTVVMGESGSGKTTLLRIAAGLMRADRGSVRLRGVEVDGAAAFLAPERRRLGMVFQDYALWPHMSSLENVAAALPPRMRDRERRAAELLASVGLTKVKHRRPEHMSGGQQQRVGLARALAAAPDLLLLDEPLSGLDLGVRERMRGLVRDLVREAGAAALFVTHDLADVWRLADRVLVLEHGRIAQDATPEELYTRPAAYRVARLMGFEGKHRVEVASRDGALGAFLGGVFQPMQAVGVAAGEPAVAMIRPDGVQFRDHGHPAECVASRFEAGDWRSTWKLRHCDVTVKGRDACRPPGFAHLAIHPDHAILFPLKSGSRHA